MNVSFGKHFTKTDFSGVGLRKISFDKNRRNRLLCAKSVTQDGIRSRFRPGIGYARTRGNFCKEDVPGAKRKFRITCRGDQYVLLICFNWAVQSWVRTEKLACRSFSIRTRDYRAKAHSEMKRSGIELARRSRSESTLTISYFTSEFFWFTSLRYNAKIVIYYKRWRE